MRLKDMEVSKIIEMLQEKGGSSFPEALSIGRLAIKEKNLVKNAAKGTTPIDQECVLTDSTAGVQVFEDRFSSRDDAENARQCLLHLSAYDSRNFLQPTENEEFDSYLKRFVQLKIESEA